MNPIRRELLNGLVVLVVASLLSVAFEAFQVTFNVQLWVLILLGIAIAVSGYVVFEIALGYMASAEERERALAESMQQREEEWLKRVGTPARLEMNREGESSGILAIVDAVKAISLGGVYTVLYYFGPEGGKEAPFLDELNANREKAFSVALERLTRGTLSEYKRIICFDGDLLATNHELKSGTLRVGEGPGTVDRRMGEHCRVMMETKGCSVYVAPAVLRLIVSLYGVDKASIAVESFDQKTGSRSIPGIIFFCDPPNGDIVEQFRQMERATERRMVAVHKIIFPEDATATAQTARR